MALRTIRVEGDPVLTKKSRPVEEMTPKISELMYCLASFFSSAAVSTEESPVTL